MTNEILENLLYDGEGGALTFKGVRYLLIRPETLVTWQKAVEEALGTEAAKLLFRGGREGGRLSTRAYQEKFGCSAAEAAAFMGRMGGFIGWGRFTLEELDPDRRRLTLQVVNSPFARAYGSSPEGVCHLIRGVFAGVAEAVLGVDVEAREVACEARGDPSCRFEFRGKERE